MLHDLPGPWYIIKTENHFLKEIDTPAKFNIAPENWPSQKERLVFQPSFFRGELLNFGGVICGSMNSWSRLVPFHPWVNVKEELVE